VSVGTDDDISEISKTHDIIGVSENESNGVILGSDGEMRTSLLTSEIVDVVASTSQTDSDVSELVLKRSVSETAGSESISLVDIASETLVSEIVGSLTADIVSDKDSVVVVSTFVADERGLDTDIVPITSNTDCDIMG